MRSYIAIGFAVVSLVAARPATAVAQDTVLAELYGHGVHSYFASQYQDAHSYLTTAIDSGIRDPRAFYFRGLAYTSLGRPDEAKADFQKGAELETAGADRVYPVSQSLQRVQGKTRMEIERQRQQARLVSRTRSVKASQARYEQLQGAEQQVLRNNPNRPQPAPAKELVGTPPTEDETDPFGGAAQPIQPAAAAPAAAPADTDTDLFGDSPAEAMPADDSSDIFGADAKVDPFADDAPAATAPAADDAPAAEEAMPAEPAPDPFADPFGS